MELHMLAMDLEICERRTEGSRGYVVREWETGGFCASGEDVKAA